jgi:hypothetical protein
MVLTQEQQLAKLLAVALYKIGEPLSISRELLDKMMPVQIILDDTEERWITLSIKSAEILIATVDSDKVTVVL